MAGAFAVLYLAVVGLAKYHQSQPRERFMGQAKTEIATGKCIIIIIL